MTVRIPTLWNHRDVDAAVAAGKLERRSVPGHELVPGTIVLGRTNALGSFAWPRVVESNVEHGRDRLVKWEGDPTPGRLDGRHRYEAAMPVAPLCAVHVPGADDLLACADADAAEVLAARLNAELATLAEGKGPGWPKLRARVVSWPYSAEAHAAEVRRLAEEGL